MLFKRKPVIVTHSTRFHADDLFATAMLLEHLDGKAEVVRTLDPKVIVEGDYVLDIGRIYDPSKNRFDHHQGDAGVRPNGIPYASAGLVWKHYGEKIAGSAKAAEMIDDKLVAQIDAVDNGIGEFLSFGGDVHPYLLNDIAGAFSNSWKEKDRDETEGFMFLLPLARAIIQREVHKAQAKIEAEAIVRKAYDEAPDKRIIVLPVQSLSIDLLQEMPEPLYAVAPHARGGWGIFAVRKEKKSFANRKDMPKAWAGLSNEDLARASGVPDAVFCHLGLFLAVAKSKEGALKMAEIAANA